MIPVCLRGIGRRIVAFTGSNLTLADCTGIALKRMGLDGLFSSTGSYVETRQWSIAIHDYPPKVDRFLYMSRHINDDRAVVLFDRAAGKLRAAKYRRLLTHAGARAALKTLHLTPT